jgi:cytoskeleton protein RodZ
MSDETEKPDENNDGPIGGERLRKARRENDISIRDVAKELHLDEHKVRALEKNEFDVLGAPVFAKGHLRKYAEIVGVDVDDVMTDYYQMTRSSGVPPIVGLKPGTAREVNAVPWIVGAVVTVVALLVGGALYWWFGARSAAPEDQDAASLSAPFVAARESEAESQTQVSEPPDAQPGAVTEPESTADPEAAADGEIAESDVVATTAQPAAEEATEEIAAEPAEQPVAAPDEAAYEPTPGAPQVSVSLTFSADCWTEVTDSSGRRLFYDLGSEGRSVNLTGDAPLRLILGDADNVSVAVEGRPWPVPASARRGQLARLTIPAQ